MSTTPTNPPEGDTAPEFFPDKVVYDLTQNQVNDANHMLERIRFQLAQDQPFYGAVLMNLPTFAHKTDSGLAWVSPKNINFTFDNVKTDGTNAFGNEGSFFKLAKQGTAGMVKIKNVVVHEILHLVLNHFYTPKAFNHQICNMAMDAELHKVMQEGGVTQNNMPEGCIWPDVTHDKINFKDMGDCPVPDLKNKTWELIYWDILKFFEKQSQEKNKSLEELIEGVIANGFSNDIPSGEDCDVDTSEMQADIDRLDQTIKSAFLRTQKAGNSPAGLERYVDNFGKSRVPWTEKFRNILRTKPFVERIDNRPNSKHIHITGIPTMPRFVGERMDALWLVFDTSGSIQPEDIQEGVDEIHGLRKVSNAELFVTSCDTQVYDVVKYDVYDFPDADKLPIKGGGGTDFRPIFEKVEEYMEEGKCEKPSVLVLVTDTYGPFPEEYPGYPTIILVPSTVGRYWGGNGNYSVPEWADLVVMED